MQALALDARIVNVVMTLLDGDARKAEFLPQEAAAA